MKELQVLEVLNYLLECAVIDYKTHMDIYTKILPYLE